MRVQNNCTEVPQIIQEPVEQIVERVVQKQRHVPMVPTIRKHVDAPQVEIILKGVEAPVQKHVHVPTIAKVRKQVEDMATHERGS